MIGVYRIYLGHSWKAAGQAPDLLGLFDSLPEFLHTATTLAESGDIQAGAGRRAGVKVAMTQAHVAVLRGGTDPAPQWTEHEIQIASSGFRWRVPIVAVMPPDWDVTSDTATTPVTRIADRIVPWSAIEVARAVQELAEAAAALRRSDLDRILPPAPTPVPGIATTGPETRHAITAAVRRLPTAEIVAAYNRLKSARSGNSPGGSI